MYKKSAPNGADFKFLEDPHLGGYAGMRTSFEKRREPSESKKSAP